MGSQALFPPILIPFGRSLLLASASISLGLALKRKDSIESPFVEITIGFFALAFFSSFADGAFQVGEELTKWFEKIGDREGLKSVIGQALKQAAKAPAGDGSLPKANVPEFLEQVWRTGVWGILSTITEVFFLLSSLLLEIGRDIVWQLILIIYPLACGVYPVWPKILQNLVLHTICVSLWWPVFTLIAVVTSIIARYYMAHTHSWGLAILALEVIAILMTFSVPVITFKLVSGAVDGSFAKMSVTNFSHTASKVTNLGKMRERE